MAISFRFNLNFIGKPELVALRKSPASSRQIWRPHASLLNHLGLFKLFASCVLAMMVLSFFVLSRKWPIVGDASLIHYICFLIDHGMAPYRDLGDMNMPGAYIVEWTVMHVFGGGDSAWRVFDFMLMAIATISFLAITFPKDRFAGWFAAAIFILVHGRDGLGQSGQRDFSMAITLLISTAFLFQAVRRNNQWLFFLFGIFSGIAATIKPTVVPFGGVLLTLALITLRRHGHAISRQAWIASAGFTVGPVIGFVFLWKQHALAAFARGFSGIVPYYASLGHRPIGFLLLHSISPLLSLVVIWLVLLLFARLPFQWERVALFCGVGFGLLSYVVQARGYPYYRYPLLVFLLPLMALDFDSALRTEGNRLVRCLGIIGFAVGCLVIAPTSLALISHYETHTDFISSLERDLNALGGPKLSTHVQCIDSISGCGSTLYKMRLVQSTGVLSDFLLFGSENTPVVKETREKFIRDITHRPPEVLIVSSWLHIDGPDEYQKLSRWPGFANYLAANYSLQTEWRPSRPDHWWSRQQWPNGYRIYILKRTAALNL
jgi:hypothetical protein